MVVIHNSSTLGLVNMTLKCSQLNASPFSVECLAPPKPPTTTWKNLTAFDGIVLGKGGQGSWKRTPTLTMRYLAKLWCFTNLDFAEIRGFPEASATFWGEVAWGRYNLTQILVREIDREKEAAVGPASGEVRACFLTRAKTACGMDRFWWAMA